MQISNILESIFVIKSIGTRFLRNVLNPIKHSCSFLNITYYNALLAMIAT